MSTPENLSLENPFVIIGDEDTILGFKALGFKAYSVRRGFNALIDEVVRNNTAICLVQGDVYRANKTEIEKYNHLPLPIFIPFSPDAKADLLDGIVKDIRRRATGKI